MEIKCSVEELKELLNIKNVEIKIDGEKVGKLIAPSVSSEFSKKIQLSFKTASKIHLISNSSCL